MFEHMYPPTSRQTQQLWNAESLLLLRMHCKQFLILFTFIPQQSSRSSRVCRICSVVGWAHHHPLISFRTRGDVSSKNFHLIVPQQPWACASQRGTRKSQALISWKYGPVARKMFRETETEIRASFYCSSVETKCLNKCLREEQVWVYVFREVVYLLWTEDVWS